MIKNFEKNILNKLLDKYEKSKLSKGGTAINRSIKLAKSNNKVIPKTLNTFLEYLVKASGVPNINKLIKRPTALIIKLKHKSINTSGGITNKNHNGKYELYLSFILSP